MRNSRNRLPFALLLAVAIAAGFTLLIAQLFALRANQAAHASGNALARNSSAYARKSDDPRLAKAYRFERGGWIYVHLEGAPHDVGYQHGYLLAPEIADAFAAVSLEMTHETGKDWNFFRRAARQMLWPKIDEEYQAELQGIVDGLQARKVKLDLDDIVAMNAFMELPDYYVPWLNEQTKTASLSPKTEGDHCSAFVATGSYTKDHQIVMAHNNWTSYLEGARWKIIFDIVPQTGLQHVDGWFSRRDRQRRRLWRQFRRPDGHRNHHHRFPRLGSATASPNSCARARPCNTPARSTNT